MATDILLATDGSSFSEQAADFIGRARLLPAGGTVHLVHVVTPLPGTVGRYLDKQTMDDWYKDQASEAMDPVAAVLKESGVPFVSKFLTGVVAQEIARYADTIDAHMIVMGAHGRGMLLDVILGSVAGRVLALSKRPVLFVH